MGPDISTFLLYYKREDIRKAMADGGADKEVAIKYGDSGFGKRPDMITAPQDILELVKKGATSFHASEELWKNPMQLSTKLSKKDLEDLRKGWDLVLDIDCPYWELSKITASLMIRALNDNGVKKSVSVKFSGNKGFHIGVPFEAFPKIITVKGETHSTEKLFPDAARKVALYIIDYIADNYCDDKGNIVVNNKTILTLEKIKEITGKDTSELAKRVCASKKHVLKSVREEKVEFLCRKCENKETSETSQEFLECKKCGNPYMEKIVTKRFTCEKCRTNEAPKTIFDPLSIVDVDTILISSRHLYRLEFSMHEKSGLVSVPFNPVKIDAFEKEFAKPENVKVSKHRFLDREACALGEARNLFLKAYDHKPQGTDDKEYEKEASEKKEFEIPEKAIPEELFPPCIKKGLEGMEDGKKRFLFLLLNFLGTAGWSHEMVEKKVNEWNAKNKEPLREQYIMGHLRYRKQHKKSAPPPNCDNNMYYKDLRICLKEYDNLCQKIKNPAQYAKRKAWTVTNSEKKGRKKEKVEESNKSK